MNLKIKSFQRFRGSNFSWRSAQTLTLPTVASTVSFTLALTMHGTSGFRGTKCELRGSQSFFRAFTTLLKIQKVKTSSVFPDNCIAVLCNEKLTCPYSHDPSRRPMAWQVPWQNDSPRCLTLYTVYYYMGNFILPPYLSRWTHILPRL